MAQPLEVSLRRGTEAREARAIAAVACPVCYVAAGEPCRASKRPHDTRLGADRRRVLVRVHTDRRKAYNAMMNARDPLRTVVVAAPHRDYSGVATGDLRWEDMDDRRELRRRHRKSGE